MTNDIDDVSDRLLVEHAARVIGVPRAEVIGDRYSFVLHAPLELLARAALLPYVEPSARVRARRRIMVLADGYEESGPPLVTGRRTDFPSVAAAGDALRAAMTSGDHDGADDAAAWLGDHAGPSEIRALLAPTLLPCLDAAGHGNIHLALLERTQPRGLPGQLLRPVVRAATSAAPLAIAVPPVDVDTDRPHLASGHIARTLEDVRPIAPPASQFIAPLVLHAEASGVFDALVDDEGRFAAPSVADHTLLRYASRAMLHGPPEHAPYGWTHCLTLAQAPLLMADRGADVGVSTYIAAAYLAAHWACHGRGRLDPDHVPAPVEMSLEEAIAAGPETAAAVAWHHPAPSVVARALASRASVHHDAHRVKYTLACLDAAAVDPPAASLHLAAAAHLASWWQCAGDPSDPRPDLAVEVVSAPAVA